MKLSQWSLLIYILALLLGSIFGLALGLSMIGIEVQWLRVIGMGMAHVACLCVFIVSAHADNKGEQHV